MSINITCIVLDDEPKAIELLKESLQYLYPDIEIIGTYTTWRDALPVLRETSFDLLFTDISIPGKNAIDILKLVPEMNSEIIFITAHSDYALSAFQFTTAGYLLKPINDAELKVAVDRAIERIKNKRLAKLNTENIPVFNSKIGIPNNKGIDYVDIKDILYFETVNKCTNIVTKDIAILSSYNIGHYKDILKDNNFYPIHRSYIINLNYIRRYETAGVLIMTNNKEIPVSKSVKDTFLEMLGKANKKAGIKNTE